MPSYAGYNPRVNPSIATEFSTVAFRFGHSLLDNEIERHDNSGQDITSDPAGASISLALDFFDPYMLNPNGVLDPYTGYASTDIDPILKADADGVSQADDLLAVNSVRNLLFGNGGQTDNGLDLIARDVERARDDGIGSYNQLRKAYGLQPVTTFAQISSNVKVQQELQKAYGTVDNIDPFEGGMAEDHMRGSDLGPLFTRILVDQFNRLRAGDRFFYLNETMSTEELSIISRGNTLGEIIQANTGITNLQNDVFVFRASISGSVLLDTVNRFTRTPSGLAGVTVNLLDSDGNVVGTTVTNGLGQYFFNQQSGVAGTGTYTVSIVLPAGDTLRSAPPPVSITRGDISARGGNFIVHQGAWRQAVAATQTTTVWALSDTPV